MRSMMAARVSAGIKVLRHVAKRILGMSLAGIKREFVHSPQSSVPCVCLLLSVPFASTLTFPLSHIGLAYCFIIKESLLTLGLRRQHSE